MKRPRILLADDHPVLLEGLRELLSPDFNVVDTVVDGRSLLAVAQSAAADVAVIDISMPLLNGIEASRRLRQSCPGTRIVILTMHKDPRLVKQALLAGAAGYVLKQSVSRDLIMAIKQVLAGGYYVSSSIQEYLSEPIPELVRRLRESPDDLTPRQTEILQLIAEGKSMKEIAALLGITIKTVEFHKYRVMRMLGLKTTAEMICYAVKRGLIDLMILAFYYSVLSMSQTVDNGQVLMFLV